MTAITDFFGKSSIPTAYAVATTVKTTRNSGVSVLEAIDMSKYAQDTPIFFVTYKKTTDPVTGVASVTNLVSWKGLVNVTANTITNLTLAPGYSDGGNAVGDFIECIPTSYWENSLMDGIFVGHNPDGSFKVAAVAAATAQDTNVVNPVGMTVDYAGVTAPAGWLFTFGQDVSRTTYSALFNVLNPALGTAVVSIAAPAVVSLTAHGMQTGDAIYFTTTGALPTGITPNTRYFIISVDANSFRLATNYANAMSNTAITTSGTQSGVHTLRRSPYGIGDGVNTFTIPDGRGRNRVGNDAMGGAAAGRLTGTVSGSVNGKVLGNAGGEEAHVSTVNEMPSHNHTYQTNDISPNGWTGSFGAMRSGGSSYTANENTDYTGGNAAHNNVAPTLVLNTIIKT